MRRGVVAALALLGALLARPADAFEYLYAEANEGGSSGGEKIG